MKRLAAAALALLVVSACAATEATPAAGPSAGKASLQTPPYSGAAGDALSPPPPPQPPLVTPAEGDTLTFQTVASQFDPARQHFVWVLPPGLHGQAPWDLKAIVKVRGVPQFETTLPLKAEMLAAGSRAEYPAGYEIVRLTDDGRWAERTAQIDGVIQKLIAEHGRGHGELEMNNTLNLVIDPAQRPAYCTANQPADVRLYLEEAGNPELIRLDVAAMTGIIQQAVKSACES
jgi:hypothetical protein